MKIKTIIIALGLVASVPSFAQSGDSAQNNVASPPSIVTPYSPGVNRNLSPNQTTEVENMIRGMILQNNAFINQQFSIRDQRDADLQNQINALRSAGSAGNQGCLVNTNTFIPESGPQVNGRVPHGTLLIVAGTSSEDERNDIAGVYKKVCVNGLIVGR